MDEVKQLCQAMERNPHVMTYSQIGNAAARGAVLGYKSGMPGGIVIGATLAVCVEASASVVSIAQDLAAPRTTPPQRPG